MEAVGQLTGGIAHDFNNLLTVISGNLEIAAAASCRQCGRACSVRRRALQRRLARGAADASAPGVLAPSAARAEGRSTSTALDQPTCRSCCAARCGEAIEIETVLAGGAVEHLRRCEPARERLLNLAVNARDAMPDGGKLTIEAANVYLDEEYAAPARMCRRDNTSAIFVSDTGGGMTPEIVGKASTRSSPPRRSGKGTGLGLSQVYGFVKQSGGHVKIYSEVGDGTTVKIYLPRLLSPRAADETRPAAAAVPRGTGETVLLVEDEPTCGSLAVDLAARAGLPGARRAPMRRPALRLLDRPREIELLFTDVGLPGGMNGRQLADEARRRRPGLKVLFTSGYARNAIVHHGRLDPGVQLITKPFTFAGLAAKLRQVLAD